MKSNKCIVVAVSEEKEKDGTPMVRAIKVGDAVILGAMVAHTGSTILIKKKEYIVVRESELLGIIKYDKEDEEEEIELVTTAVVN